MLPSPSVAELAEFTGRPEASFSSFATQALLQATLMFSTITGLDVYPVDTDKALLAQYAIMEMADRLLLEQPHSVIKSGPFQTETIGSYSYSKMGTTWTLNGGAKTGLWWWDLAIEELKGAGEGDHAHGSIAVGNVGVIQTQSGPAQVNTVLLGVHDSPWSHDPNLPPYARIS